MEITYTRKGDILIPDLMVHEVQATYSKYGLMRKEFLKEHKPALYGSLVLSENLIPHLNDIDELARDFVNCFIERKSKEQNINEELKSRDPLAWVGAMNSIKNQAEEAAIREIIYGYSKVIV